MAGVQSGAMIDRMSIPAAAAARASSSLSTKSIVRRRRPLAGRRSATVMRLWRMSVEPHKHAPTLNPHGVGRKIGADRRPARGAAAIVELAVVFWTFDHVVHHKALGQMHLFVSAKPVRAIVVVGRAAVDSEGAAAVVQADHILGVDLVRGADINP